MGSPHEEADVMRELRGQGTFACWQALRDARRDLEVNMRRSFGDCVDWSKRQFRDLFHVIFYIFIGGFVCFLFFALGVPQTVGSFRALSKTALPWLFARFT